MTEAEWNACTDPQPMLEFLRGKASDRKLRLLLAACCRRAWQILVKDESPPAVRSWCEDFGRILALVEEYADGQADGQALKAGDETAAAMELRIYDKLEDGSFDDDVFYDHWDAACAVTYLTCANLRSPTTSAPSGEDHAAAVLYCSCSAITRSTLSDTEGRSEQVAIFRDSFDNSFRPVPTNPCHLSVTVRAIAEAIYTDRAFDRLPILADALEDAGCTDQYILAHCRGPGPHVRGCWVVDLLTGRE